MIGKKVFIISDHKKFNGYVGQIVSVINENTFEVMNDSIIEKVNIFDVRSMPYEF